MWSERALDLSRTMLAANPEVDELIKQNTENHRKASVRLEVLDADGAPAPKAKVRFRQLSHEFRFGCNCFLLDNFPEPEKNVIYRELWKELFNEAVVPFYWSDLEPRRGEYRFAHDAPFIERRPPVDLVLEYCRDNRITPKGHPLLWQGFMPSWLSEDPLAVRDALEERMMVIGERYAKEIRIWDVINEPLSWNPIMHTKMPDHPVETAFGLAEKYFPGCKLVCNDDCRWYQIPGDYSPLYMLGREMLRKNLKLDALGLQYHLFPNHIMRGRPVILDPEMLYYAFTQFAKLNLPLIISEVSIIGSLDLGDGEDFQKQMAERLYRLWFSHPAIESIVWWNFVDGTQGFAPNGDMEHGDNSLRSGLLRYDMTTKPAYHALHHLIKTEWNSQGEMAYEQGADNTVRLFYGRYQLEIETDAANFTQEISLSKHAGRHFILGPSPG